MALKTLLVIAVSSAVVAIETAPYTAPWTYEQIGLKGLLIAAVIWLATRKCPHCGAGLFGPKEKVRRERTHARQDDVEGTN